MGTIPVPSQPKLHKQWCLFDNSENIDFDREVRKIAGTAEDNLGEEVNGREGRKVITEDDIVEIVKDSEFAEDILEKIVNQMEKEKMVGIDEETVIEQLKKDAAISDLSVQEINNFLSQLTLLDVQSPVKRDLEQLFEDFAQSKEFARGFKDKEAITKKNKGNIESKRKNTKHRNKKSEQLSKATVKNKKVKISKIVSRKKH